MLCVLRILILILFVFICLLVTSNRFLWYIWKITNSYYSHLTTYKLSIRVNIYVIQYIITLHSNHSSYYWMVQFFDLTDVRFIKECLEYYFIFWIKCVNLLKLLYNQNLNWEKNSNRTQLDIKQWLFQFIQSY